MTDVIPDNILTRIKIFAAEGKTGQIVLNVYCGGVVSADIREHIKSSGEKSLDKVKVTD
jgi:hypothetical protein